MSLCLANMDRAEAQCLCYNCTLPLPDNVNTPYIGQVIVNNTTNNTLGVDNALEQVCIDLTHTWIGDLDITLTAPDGTSVILFADGNNDISLGGTQTLPFGNSGDDMDVCFVLPGGATNIFGSGASCTGSSYEDPCNGPNPPCYNGDWGTYNEGCQGGNGLAEFNNGTGSVSGTWIITINDNAGADLGVLNEVELVFTNPPDSCSQEPPPPPALCGNTTVVAIPDNGSAVTSTIPNTGSLGTMGQGTEVVSVCALIDHDYLADLDVYLQEPDGSQVELTTDNGSFTDDYGDVFGPTEVCFTTDGANNITSYTGGLTGNWVPEGDILSFDGPANGNWTLSVTDDASGVSGSILQWSILFSNGDCSYDCDYIYNVRDSICSGQSYVFDGNILTAAGTYYDTTTLTSGCDSIVRLTLSLEDRTTVIDTMLCLGDSLTFDGMTWYSGFGTFYDTLAAYDGCDSVIRLNLSSSPYSTFRGLYAGTATDYYKLDPLTGSPISTLNASPLNVGWVNAAFSIHETAVRVFWISHDYNLYQFSLLAGFESWVATDISTLPSFWGLRYYNGWLYTVSTSGDDDKMLVRVNPGTGLLDAGFTPIEINGTAGYNYSFGSNLVADPISGMLYIPLQNNVMLEFDVVAGTGTVINLTGALPTPGFVDLLTVDEYSGQIYGLTSNSDVVSVTLTGATTANVAVVKSLTTVTGYANPTATFDSDNKLYIFQGEDGCSTFPMVAVDVTTGQEYCSNPPGTVLMHLAQVNCMPSIALRTAELDELIANPPAYVPVYPRPKGKKPFNVTMYPMPVIDYLNMEFVLYNNETIKLTLFSPTGLTVRESEHEGISGINNLKVDLAKLKRGIYFLEMQAGDDVYSGKVVKR